MLTPILIALVAVIILFIIIVSMRPPAFSVSRSATMSAPPDVVFPHVNDLHKWEAWSPWAKIDPNAKNLYDGPPAGVGAMFSWEGNNKVGAGRMTIVESRPNELVRFKLDFLKPMRSTNEAIFTFKEDAGKTTVTWTMSGKCNFMAKVFGLIMDCDKMIGPHFEKGLADMRSIVEQKAVSQR